ncbi:MAG: hypothetical protein OXQ31_12580 [Spirochaetaceae bacterium]|nr:hypothetical protein [Spirochaetaceae bacterium]
MDQVSFQPNLVGEYTVHLVVSDPDWLTASVDGEFSPDDAVDVYRASGARLVTMTFSGPFGYVRLARMASDGSKELIAAESGAEVKMKVNLKSGVHYLIVSNWRPEADEQREYNVQMIAEEVR